jgi:pimeloyl-ACP methyl ester carboxylesterase
VGGAAPAAAIDATPDPAVERPAIVFLHATRLTGAQWAAQVADLSPEFRCFTPDLPGHGTAADVPFDLDVAARRTAELIEREAGGHAVVVGLSLGGYVAMEVAARRPELVRGLVLAGATAEPRGLLSAPFRGLARAYGLVPDRLLTRQQRWAFRLSYPASITEPILADGFWFRGGATAVRSLIGEAFKPRLARYPGPTLLINGQLDLLFRLTERSFAAAASDARRVTIRGAGHRSNLDRPASFSAAVHAFARDITASGA